MKQLVMLFCCIWSLGLFAQKSAIENTRLSLSPSLDSLIIHYDLTGKYPAFNMKLQVTDSAGKNIPAISLSGDINRWIKPGANKTIFWNMYADQAKVYGTDLNISVCANVSIPRKVKKKIWIPWLYIASAASASIGVTAHLKSNSLYQEYIHLSTTDEAEKLNHQIKGINKIRNFSYGAAAVFGLAGVVVHIRHIHKTNSFAVIYQPLPDGATLELTYNF